MSIDFTPWPEALARRYRERGYWTDRPLTDIIARQAKNDAVALIDPQRSLSYRRLNQLSDRLAAALQRRGLHSGDTALVQLGNVVEFYVAFFALLKIGVVPVNALFSHQRNELKAYAAQIKPALLIADRQHGLFGNDEFLTTFRDENPSLRVVGLRSQAEGEQSLAAWLEEDTDDFIATPTPADQVAFFQLSGGSTGTPKLIPRTHNDYYYSIRRSVEICHFDAHTRYLCALPVAHNYPMSSPGVLGVFYGAGLVVFASDPDAGQCFRLIEQHQINVTALVPPAVTLWLQAIEEWGGGQPLASLKLLQVGGAKLSETLAARIPAEIGCQLQQVFGMAEGLVNYTRLDDDDRHILTTQGCPMSPDDELWVADDEGNRLPVGQTGRLMTRGPYTFRGYYQSPEHNAAAFDKDGFYCSGDLISLTEDGYVKVEGRQKDQINRGGEKIAAEEIENLLLRHPEVINAALVSMPDELMGEKSCAFIIAASALKPVVLRRHLRAEGVAEFKLPDRFIQVDTLPLTPVGKVDKKRLRQRLETQSLTQAQGE
ncbi:2,3-dihydroxybenzoate-AMP ligase [Serratia sp. AS12]|uniref:(2,3-dihydroxybenzoyl)adenylate synthase n=1 Tax=Serratia TaxID=613 RepID=UPI00020E9D1B|nr:MULTISPECIES: (2,3-dihydroxybenzoyl)adenylate synthase [Serratia]AEF46722.1 2,3-dihydroxybenzoate-AMP ligase [Serratia plymuthica AS9]AEF51674.1 2,3-dihydroxybenzoate-AMP ligase [Serratia sp. AS12]AEG29381.1 2,3-dihydroxybenzoate-AMP ligase [Serratia sp. AS13]UTN95422.1 (2,3-dihydroxybenzoyl)adenylate synthase [Serratia plymuthica]